MTNHTVRKLLLLEKRLRTLARDVEAWRETLSPAEKREFGEAVSFVETSVWGAYHKLLPITTGLAWPSKQGGKKNEK